MDLQLALADKFEIFPTTKNPSKNSGNHFNISQLDITIYEDVLKYINLFQFFEKLCKPYIRAGIAGVTSKII